GGPAERLDVCGRETHRERVGRDPVEGGELRFERLGLVLADRGSDEGLGEEVLRLDAVEVHEREPRVERTAEHRRGGADRPHPAEDDAHAHRREAAAPNGTFGRRKNRRPPSVVLKRSTMYASNASSDSPATCSPGRFPDRTSSTATRLTSASRGS